MTRKTIKKNAPAISYICNIRPRIVFNRRGMIAGIFSDSAAAAAYASTIPGAVIRDAIDLTARQYLTGGAFNAAAAYARNYSRFQSGDLDRRRVAPVLRMIAKIALDSVNWSDPAADIAAAVSATVAAC